jgi:cytosine/adenosine deaminase-related metal-dependent hydrolase
MAARRSSVQSTSRYRIAWRLRPRSVRAYSTCGGRSHREFDLIADSGGSISLSPSVDMLMALGTYPATGHALARGIAAGLSVDTTTGSGTDLFTEMRLALAAERSRANADAVSRHEAVEVLPNTTVIGQFRDRVAARRGHNIGVVVAGRRQLEYVFYALRDHHVRALNHSTNPPARTAA